MAKYLPTFVYSTVFDIDYTKLYALGKRIILFDLDNTLISYYESVPSKELIDLSNNLLNMGFKVYVLTNNHGSRIETFMKNFPGTSYGSHALKPYAFKIRKILKRFNVTNYDEIIMIGDQLVTDILCANRLKVDSVLLKSISRESEHLYTRINRAREKHIVKKLYKINEDIAKQVEIAIRKD